MSLATVGYSQHCHLRFITTLEVMHLSPSDQLSVALVFDFRRLFTSVLLSQKWSSLYFFLFLTSSTEILNRCFKKLLQRQKHVVSLNVILFGSWVLWFSAPGTSAAPLCSLRSREVLPSQCHPCQLQWTRDLSYQQLVSETPLSRPGQSMYIYAYCFIVRIDIYSSTTLHHLASVTS